MSFSSLTFLCVFLPASFFIYWVTPKQQFKNAVLVAASLVFYSYGNLIFLPAMLMGTAFNYLAGLILSKTSGSKKTSAFVCSIALNIGLLLLFKVIDSNAQVLLLSENLSFMPDSSYATLLPLGISVFTFQSISYLSDVYRQKTPVQKNYLKVLLYLSFFARITAGPIMKYHDLENQLGQRALSTEKVAHGLRRFSIGLAKKVLIADIIARLVDVAFSVSPGSLGPLGAWSAALAFSIQLYFDFSGYSDMAIGLGQMFGFKFVENFNYPFTASSIRDFWRKWNISLSEWFKEYIYIPLGGSKKGGLRAALNTMIVFLCTGLWHGANPTFLVWGIWHGVFCVAESHLPLRRLPAIIRHSCTLLIVVIGFVMFRAHSLSQGFSMIVALFTGWGHPLRGFYLLVPEFTPLLIVTIVVSLVGVFPLKELLVPKKTRLLDSGFVAASYLGAIALLALCLLSLSGGFYAPFIYAQF
jgi:alginate O-acetyltransferase complex protein AlgI